MVKNPLANAGDVRDTGSIPGWGRSPGGGHGIPLQYSCLEKPMGGGARWATVHGVAKSRIHRSSLSMAIYSSVLAWRILGTGEPGGLPSLGPHRVGHD